jgi:hypothetical protein
MFNIEERDGVNIKEATGECGENRRAGKRNGRH